MADDDDDYDNNMWNEKLDGERVEEGIKNSLRAGLSVVEFGVERRDADVPLFLSCV